MYTKTKLEMKCYNCGNKHCKSDLCLEEHTLENDKKSYSFSYNEERGLSRSIFVSKEDLKKLASSIKEILK